MRFLSLIVAPALFWLVYHYYKDRRKPEPVHLVVLSFVLGVAAGFVCLKGYEIAERLGAASDPYELARTSKAAFLAYSIVVIGLLEEGVKFLPFWLVCLRLKAFDEEIDGIVYASAVALGFASYENVLYMEFLEGVDLAARAVASPLTHAMFASIWGHACARAVLRGKSLWPAALLGLAVSALVHGLYDFLLLAAPPVVRPIPAAIVLAIWIWRIRLTERAGRPTARS